MDPMGSGADPPRYRWLRKASDLRTPAAAHPLRKRMRLSEEHDSFCEDKISSLPEDILIMIVDKLDARTAITTTILSKRWRDLPARSQTCYDLGVNDILPPRYHRLKQMVVEAKAGYVAEKLAGSHAFRDRFFAVNDWMWMVRRLTTHMRRYERWAMRRYVKRVNALLLPPTNVQQRSIQKLSLQTFGASNCIDQWIMSAIDRWGVEDLELVIDNSSWGYDFRLLNECKNVQLKRLMLSNCYDHDAPYSLTFQRLTSLTLCKECSHISYVCDLLRNCVQLVDLILKYSGYNRDSLRIRVPKSKLKNLQLDNCKVGQVYLISLPCLEAFACRGQPIELYYGEVPRLRHVCLNFLQTGDNGKDGSICRLSKLFLGIPPPLEYLALQLRGDQMWIKPVAIRSQLNHLKKLFIANVATNWDTFWILTLLAAAPALESLHVHFDNNSEKVSAAGSPDVQVEHHQHHHHMKELMVIGFAGVAWQTGFVKRIMQASPMLGRVHLLDGYVVEDEERDLVSLEIVRRRREWHKCKRSEVLNELTDGISSPHLEIVLE